MIKAIIDDPGNEKILVAFKRSDGFVEWNYYQLSDGGVCDDDNVEVVLKDLADDFNMDSDIEEIKCSVNT